MVHSAGSAIFPPELLMGCHNTAEILLQEEAAPRHALCTFTIRTVIHLEVSSNASLYTDLCVRLTVPLLLQPSRGVYLRPRAKPRPSRFGSRWSSDARWRHRRVPRGRLRLITTSSAKANITLRLSYCPLARAGNLGKFWMPRRKVMFWLPLCRWCSSLGWLTDPQTSHYLIQLWPVSCGIRPGRTRSLGWAQAHTCQPEGRVNTPSVEIAHMITHPSADL